MRANLLWIAAVSLIVVLWWISSTDAWATDAWATGAATKTCPTAEDNALAAPAPTGSAPTAYSTPGARTALPEALPPETVSDSGDQGNSATGASSFRVRVLWEEDGLPAAGVEVWHFTQSLAQILKDQKARAQLASGWSRDLKFLERFGAAVRTDRRGIAELPRSGWGLHCLVEEKGRRGLLVKPHAQPGRKPHLMVLRADDAVTLRVRTAAGQPAAGVRVRAVRQLGTRQMAFVVGTTDSTGRFVFDHVQERSHRWPKNAAGQPQTRLGVEVLGADPGIDLIAAALPTAEVRLTLPPTGIVEVQLRGPAGAPAADVYAVELRQPDARAAGTRSRREGKPLDSSLVAPQMERGSALFSWVALNCALQANVRVQGKTIGKEFLGPVRPGQSVTATVCLPEDDYLLCGQALDSDRRPFSKATIRARALSQDGSSIALAHGSTDEEGRFRLRLCGALHQTDWGAMRLTAVRKEAAFACPGPVLWRPQAGVTDLGVVFLRRDPVLVRGRVTTPDGAPFATAVVTAWTRRGHQYHARSAADGSFAVYGADLEAGDLRVRARAPGWASRGHASCRPGAAGVELRLRPLHRFTCHLRAVGRDVPGATSGTTSETTAGTTAGSSAEAGATADATAAAGAGARAGSKLQAKPPTLQLLAESNPQAPPLRSRRVRTAKGWRFEMPEVPAGRYILRVANAAGQRVAQRALTIPDVRRITVDLPPAPHSAATLQPAVSQPGTTPPPVPHPHPEPPRRQR